MSCASLPDTNLCSRQRFYVWPAMLGDSVSVVKEIAPVVPRLPDTGRALRATLRPERRFSCRRRNRSKFFSRTSLDLDIVKRAVTGSSPIFCISAR
jgi:hypothetical protein